MSSPNLLSSADRWDRPWSLWRIKMFQALTARKVWQAGLLTPTWWLQEKKKWRVLWGRGAIMPQSDLTRQELLVMLHPPTLPPTTEPNMGGLIYCLITKTAPGVIEEYTWPPPDSGFGFLQYFRLPSSTDITDSNYVGKIWWRKYYPVFGI